MNDDQLREWWTMSETLRVLKIVKDVEVGVLANWDGCCCGGFSIRNVDVYISCGKGTDRGLWISGKSLDYWKEGTADDCDEDLLRPIAEEIARQVRESDCRGLVPIHFHKFGRENS